MGTGRENDLLKTEEFLSAVAFAKALALERKEGQLTPRLLLGGLYLASLRAKTDGKDDSAIASASLRGTVAELLTPGAEDLTPVDDLKLPLDGALKGILRDPPETLEELAEVLAETVRGDAIQQGSGEQLRHEVSLRRKASAGRRSDTAGPADRIAIAPLPSEWPTFDLAIAGVSCEGPDDEDDTAIEIDVHLHNDTDQDFDYVDVQLLVLDSHGFVLEERSDTEQETIAVGETGSVEFRFWRDSATLVGNSPNGGQVVARAIACCTDETFLGKVAVPKLARTRVALEPGEVEGVLKVVSGFLWKMMPGDDQECEIEIRLLVQNLTDKYLPMVALKASITDKQGTELTDLESHDAILPGALTTVAVSGSVKARKLSGAKALITLQAGRPVAAAIVELSGYWSRNARTKKLRFNPG